MLNECGSCHHPCDGCPAVALIGELFVGVLRHAIRLSPFGERMKVRGLFFGLAKSPFDG